MSERSRATGTRTAKQRAGDRAEEIAAAHLARHGVVTVARNYRCRLGEIDLVCDDAGALVFVEVRLRRSAGYGGAGSSIDFRKQQRIVAAARHYLATQAARAGDRACRFDAVLLDGLDDARVEWIRDAFGT
jgi:putative endonuclease